MKTEKPKADFYQNSFNMSVKIESMLRTNQLMIADILSKIKDTNQQNELKEIHEYNKRFENEIRENMTE